MDNGGTSSPFLRPSSRPTPVKITGKATAFQTLGNIVVSIVGTGVLGLPYAFSVSGWASGAIGVTFAGLASYYCMLLLVECRDKLEEKDMDESSPRIQTYGDLGEKAFGKTGRYLTEILVLVSQGGGAIAYLVFISQNFSSFSFTTTPKILPSLYIFLLLLPIEIVLSFIRSLSSIATFSIFADVCNAFAMAVVIKEDLQLFQSFSTGRRAFNGIWSIPFAGGIAVFCFEGFTMTLHLEASMADPRKFRRVLSQAILVITTVYVCFGSFGYLAYGEETKDIITLNLSDNWSAALIKVGLSTALAFTFPVMMHPIHEIMEGKVKPKGWWMQKLCCNARIAECVGGVHGVRVLMVVIVAALASLVPNFGGFISLVGSTLCALLSFVLPVTFHLRLLGPCLCWWRRALDYGILITGLIFGGYGLYQAISGRSFGS